MSPVGRDSRIGHGPRERRKAMEAKETAMRDDQIMSYWVFSRDQLRHLFLSAGRTIAQAQAKISFEAGRREAVEWLRSNGFLFPGHLRSDLEKLQAKLKEWEVKP